MLQEIQNLLQALLRLALIKHHMGVALMIVLWKNSTRSGIGFGALIMAVLRRMGTGWEAMIFRTSGARPIIPDLYT